MTDEARGLEHGPIVALFFSTGASMRIKIKYAPVQISGMESHVDPEFSSGEKPIKFFIHSHLIKYIKAAKLVELK